MGTRQRSGGTLLLACTICAALLIPTVAEAAPGDLDPSFGNGGKVKRPTEMVAAMSVAVDSQGRILAAGVPPEGHSAAHFVLARYRSNGRLDRSFGDGGIAVTRFRGDLSSIAIDQSGRIVAAGCTTRADFKVARYHADGAPDNSFGNAGVVTTDFGQDDCAFSVGIDSRGRIVAVGNRGLGSRGGWFALARYKSNGTLDDSFSGDGKALAGFRDRATGARATSAAIDSRDRVVAAGSIATAGYPGDRDFALVRFSSNGRPTTQSFGTRGKATTDFGAEDYANSVVFDSEGRIVAAGETGANSSDNSFALVRYLPDGSLDRTFGGDGTVVTDLGSASDVAIDSEGRIVAMGYTRYGPQCPPNPCGPRYAVARYLPEGGLDPAFGGDGKVTTGGLARPISMAIDSQDRIIGAGFGSFLLARYLGR